MTAASSFPRRLTLYAVPTRSRPYVPAYLLVLFALAGCSGTTSRPAAATPQGSPGAVSVRISQLLPTCDSTGFALSGPELATAPLISADEARRRSSERFTYASRGLSLVLQPVVSTFTYAEPVAFRIAITNQSGQAIVFCRPKGITIESQPPLAGVIVNLRPVSHEWHRGFAWIQWAASAPSPEEFTRLPLGASCTMDFELHWEEGTLRSPPPPGDYLMDARLHSWWGAPLAQRNSMTFYDLEAWVGETERSNTITLTVVPSDD